MPNINASSPKHPLPKKIFSFQELQKQHLDVMRRIAELEALMDTGKMKWSDYEKAQDRLYAEKRRIQCDMINSN